MTFIDWISIGIACFIGAASPGPSLLIIIFHTSSKGIIQGFLFSVGHGIGVFIYAMLSVLGIKFFFTNFPEVLFCIKIVGIFFLLFLGIKMIIYKNKNQEENLLSKINFQNYNSLSLGIFTSLINPKVILFFGAIFSQFIKIDLNLSDKFFISLLASLIDAIWYAIIVFLSTLTISNVFKKYKKITINALGFVLVLITLMMILKII